jgi:hypothetical protein
MMAETCTLARAFADLASVSAAALVEQLATVRSAAAAIGDEFQIPAAGGGGGLGDYLQGLRTPPPAAGQAGENNPQAMPSAGMDGAAGDLPRGPATATLGAELAEAVAGALDAWQTSTENPPGNDSLPGLTPAAAGAGPTTDAHDSQTELLRDCVEINRSLLELAQGTGIKVDMPDPAWGV